MLFNKDAVKLSSISFQLPLFGDLFDRTLVSGAVGDCVFRIQQCLLYQALQEKMRHKGKETSISHKATPQLFSSLTSVLKCSA